MELPPDCIQAISHKNNRLIILIYLDSAAVQMFFPNKNDFFIREKELATLTFRQVLENRELNIDSFEKGFVKININIDLPMIDFLQSLFNLSGVIGMLSTGREYAHFQAFQLKSLIPLNRNNENIDKNINDSEYGLPSNNINIEEDQVLNENKTKEEKKNKKTKHLHVILQLFSKHLLLINKKNQKKMLNSIYINILVSYIRKKMDLIY
jgi:hypothetical protein